MDVWKSLGKQYLFGIGINYIKIYGVLRRKHSLEICHKHCVYNIVSKKKNIAMHYAISVH